MGQTSISIRIDEELKKNMEQTCQELGLNMTTAFTIFAKKMTREQRIPFDVSINIPNTETITAIEAVKNGDGLSRSFSSVKDLMEDLNAGD